MNSEDKSKIIERLHRGMFATDYSGRFCYESDDVSVDLYICIRKEIRKAFSLVPAFPMISSSDEIFQPHINGFCLVGIEWDHWSGLIVVALNKRAEGLVRRIGEHLESMEI